MERPEPKPPVKPVLVPRNDDPVVPKPRPNCEVDWFCAVEPNKPPPVVFDALVKLVLPPKSDWLAAVFVLPKPVAKPVLPKPPEVWLPKIPPVVVLAAGCVLALEPNKPPIIERKSIKFSTTFNVCVCVGLEFGLEWD